MASCHLTVHHDRTKTEVIEKCSNMHAEPRQDGVFCTQIDAIHPQGFADCCCDALHVFDQQICLAARLFMA
eukprot:4562168-Amphidinium_carterae.1